MIINSKHRFAFVHIPKCAGSTVRAALERFDENKGVFFGKGVASHPVLGTLDYHHIPLAVLEAHFPDDFAQLSAYRSFALVRDPYSRFPSSLHEHLLHRDAVPLSLRKPSELAREIDSVLERLSKLPRDEPIIDSALIHLSRQTDYISLNGRQVIDQPRTVAEVDDVLRDIAELTGTAIQSREAANPRLGYAFPAVRSVQHALTTRIERTLPRKIWKPVYTPIKWAMRRAGLIHSASIPLSELPNAPELEAFVSEFYAKDIRLFARLDARRQATSREPRTNVH